MRRTMGFPSALAFCALAGFAMIYSGLAPAVWQRGIDDLMQVDAGRTGNIVSAQNFAECSSSRTPTCVVDGDTIRVRGTTIRIADIDTPEVFSPQCAEELVRGNRATQRMVEVLSAGSFEMVGYDSRDEDRYGRKLRVLMRDGKSLGQVLVTEGLARTWDGARHAWC